MIENGKIVDSIGNKNEDIEQYVYKAYKQNKEKVCSWLFTRIVLEVIRIILICIFWKEVFYGLLFNSTI